MSLLWNAFAILSVLYLVKYSKVAYKIGRRLESSGPVVMLAARLHGDAWKDAEGRSGFCDQHHFPLGTICSFALRDTHAIP